MADDDNATGTGAAGDGGAGGDATGGDKDSGAKKALDSERAARRKAEADAKAARDELTKIKNDMAAGKTDAERTAQMLAELRERADASDMRALRAEVAQSKGLTAAQAKRLQGTTVEELEADAEELLAAFKPVDGAAQGDAASGADAAATGGQQRQTASAARPRENLRAGTATSTTDQGTEYDSKTFLAALPRG
jgi:hypothetical protein